MIRRNATFPRENDSVTVVTVSKNENAPASEPDTAVLQLGWKYEQRGVDIGYVPGKMLEQPWGGEPALDFEIFQSRLGLLFGLFIKGVSKLPLP